MPRPLARRLFAGVASVLLLALAAAAPAPPPPPPPGARDRVWPQSYSDIAPDPAIRFGILPNGMRYALLHNDTPTGQTALRLRIGAGSLDESDAQQGLAHLLEHMAFKGSIHAPGTDNEMVKVLERLGLSFGGDTNARTEFNSTTYQFDLPNSDPATLQTGLTLLGDVASGLLLDPAAMQSERGVVLSEERGSDTPSYEVFKARLGLELKGQRAADRLPIGRVEVVRNAPASLVRDFYRVNYRPERAVLIAVGDFDVAAMQRRVEATFGGWRAQAPAPAPVDLGHPLARGVSTQLVVRRGVAPSLALVWTSPRDERPDSRAKERDDFVQNLALAALNRRYARAAQAPDAPFLAAGVSRGDIAHSARLTQLHVVFRPGRWREALEAAVRMQRQALRYGFSQAEVDRELTEAGTPLENAVAGAATRRTPALADELARSVDEEEVETSPAQDLALYHAFAQGLGAPEVSAALAPVFQGSGPLVSLASPDPIDGGEGALQAAYRSALAAPIAPPAALKPVSWTHTDFGAPGRVVERREVADLGVSFVRFANGVVLAVRPSALRKDQVLVSVNFGHGRLSLPKDRTAADWATGAFVPGGLDDLTAEEIQQATADRTVSASLSEGDDAFSLSGATRPSDLALQMQLLAAYMTRPGWRPEAFARTKAVIGLALGQLSATPQGVQARDLPALEHDGDRRWAYPTAAELGDTRLDQLKAILDPALKEGPLEVVVAGDTTVDQAIAAVTSTFAALPPRPIDPPPAGARVVAFPQPSPSPVVRLHHGRPDQAIALQAWPGVDLLSDPQRARRLNIAAEVLQLRLNDQIRAAQGTTYSPAAGASESEVFPGYGYAYASVEIPPPRIAGFYATTDAIAADLAARPIGADELQRAVRPRVEGIARAQQTNGYWLALLHDASGDPRRLDLARSSIPGYDRLTAADIQSAAQAFLKPQTAWRFQVTPAAP